MFNEFLLSRTIIVTWKANGNPKVKDKSVITIDEGEELYNSNVIEFQKISDEEYDILDYKDNDVKTDISTEGASAELLVQTGEDTP